MPLDKICECRREKQESVIKMSSMDGSEENYPCYAHPGDAGMDIKSNEEIVIPQGSWKTIGSGIRVKVPEGFVGLVCPRSGLASKFGITVENAPGILDSSYTGELKVIIINHSNCEYVIKKGDKIAQLVIAPFVSPKIMFVSEEEMDELNTERGNKGFGSSGR
ncbi:MAG: dUTP diphosphatase [Paludibacteraceae bacterium]|nr:dUTP diphosphatase [Paludibacteraceae bacterium]MCK9616034.1 dUTP diphosphatase [Candidatus Omnitrophota bacterium]